ncbi:MAG: zinc-dependent metalloprotease [Nitriliruptoraceae bacterium]
MSDPSTPDDPFEGLPPELRALFAQLGGGDAARLAAHVSAAMSATRRATDGPVDFALAERVARDVAASGDRPATAEESRRAHEALTLAEHWLDDTGLPSPPDAGRLVVASRTDWLTAAIPALRPLIEPVARASVNAMVALAREQLTDVDADSLASLGIELPEGFADVLAQLAQGDVGQMLRPAAAAMAGLQAGQIVGQLSRQLHGQYDLGVPTAPAGQAYVLAVNVTETFDGYDLDETEVAIMVAVTEAAHRRVFHAVGWLASHTNDLVAEFARGTHVDADRLDALSDELLMSVDPDDPDALRAAMEKAAQFRLEPTDAQRRVLERLQTVVCVTDAWARLEARRAVGARLPARDRIEEVLRRRRATRGDGEELLTALLGLDLRPADESLGDVFVVTVDDTLGPSGLRQVLAHPENLPDGDELRDPARWLTRMATSTEIPEDLTQLFADLGDAPVEASAEERTARPDKDDDGHGAG